MNKHSMIFIGLDTHKEFHEVAYCEEQRGATPVHYGRIPSSKVSVKKLLRQFVLLLEVDLVIEPLNLKHLHNYLQHSRPDQLDQLYQIQNLSIFWQVNLIFYSI